MTLGFKDVLDWLVLMLACWIAMRYYRVMPKLHAGRRFELVYQDPFTYHEHLNVIGECEVLFDFGTLRKKKIDAYKWMRQHFSGRPWKCYISGNWHTVLIDHTCKPGENRGVWPSWEYKNYDLKELQGYIEKPWSTYMPGEYLGNSEIILPRHDQPHKIFIRDVFAGTTLEEKQRRVRLTEIQRKYPEVELFLIPSSYSFGLMFGAGFTATCYNPVRDLKLNAGSIRLANGRRVLRPQIVNYEPEIAHFGYEAIDVEKDMQTAILYMIDVARYAAHHWDDPTGPFRVSKRIRGDYQTSDMYVEVPSYQNQKHFDPKNVKETDKILCNACSLWRKCPSYRSEEVCNLSSSETRKLSQLAGSRNAEDVVEMLAGVVKLQAERLENRMKDEATEATDGYDPQIDKLLNSVFKNGVSLAKLRDPSLGRPLVQINANLQQAPAIGQGVVEADPRAIASQVVAEIERSGVPRKDITPEMVQNYINGHFGKPQELEPVDAEIEDVG